MIGYSAKGIDCPVDTWPGTEQARMISRRSGVFHVGPTLVLLSRCVNAIVDGPEPDHPVLILKSK